MASSPFLEPRCCERTQLRPGTYRLAVTRRASYHRANLTPSPGMVTLSLLLDTTTSSFPSSSECITTMTRGNSQGRLDIIIDQARNWTFDPGRDPGHSIYNPHLDVACFSRFFFKSLVALPHFRFPSCTDLDSFFLPALSFLSCGAGAGARHLSFGDVERWPSEET
jgi:hypothetical protein